MSLCVSFFWACGSYLDVVEVEAQQEDADDEDEDLQVSRLGKGFVGSTGDTYKVRGEEEAEEVDEKTGCAIVSMRCTIGR